MEAPHEMKLSLSRPIEAHGETLHELTLTRAARGAR